MLYNTEQSKTIIENAMAVFGLSQDMETDPQIIKSIIDEIKLNDFKTNNKHMDTFFKDAISKPQKLQPMFDNIQKGILSKHPTIVEFAAVALEKKWLYASRHVVLSVHMTYILEALTAAMCNSHDFFIEVQDHYKAKERERGLSTTHILRSIIRAIHISHNFFGSIKAFSVDPAMIFFRLQRGFGKSQLGSDEAKKLLKDKKINYLEYKLLSPLLKNGLGHIHELLRINIYEAGITEYKRGLKTNAICAHELSEDIKKNPPQALFEKKSVAPENNTDNFYPLITEKENIFPVIACSQEWVSLYTTWNMAFVLHEFDDLDIIFPKLLIPSIINAESENFLGSRIISLWLSAHHVFFRKYDKKTVVGPEKKYEMARAWAEINKKYAFQLAKKEMHEDSQTLMKSYNRFFSQPIYNLCKIVHAFLG